ncbi:hypothetical protein AB0K00_52140 [Dactylosporangium sp. NPDC049525]|uniref:hypothetical protein n=1 Tax=Dactylosporangium sp. NPDC049525 TaxID=3154730 RepID=UPI00341AC489
MTDWERMPGPAAVVRVALPAGVARTAPLAAIVADATAGLAARFAAVRAIHAETSGRIVHLVHAATAPDGEGIVVETRLDREGAVFSWVSPMHRYLTDRAAARRAMAGRRARPGAGDPDRDGVPLAEAWLELDGAVLTARRCGPVAECGATVPVPASTLPALLAEAVGLSPRPAPERVELTLGSRDDLDGFARWRLDWLVGRGDMTQPDGDWSAAHVSAAGTLEVVDRGPAFPLLRVLDELPGPLAADAAEADPTGGCVGVVAITPAEVFALLAALAG